MAAAMSKKYSAKAKAKAAESESGINRGMALKAEA
jgi:hypothetical protein